MSELSDLSERERYGTCDDEGQERVRCVASEKQMDSLLHLRPIH